MIYELRIYECVPGRLPALHDRFRNITRTFFAKHQIEVVGYWEDLIGENNRLTWMIRWQSLADREKKWDAFATDPEWVAARLQTEASGPIVARIRNTLMRSVDYSPTP